jgi:hypothetical protein
MLLSFCLTSLMKSVTLALVMAYFVGETSFIPSEIALLRGGCLARYAVRNAAQQPHNPPPPP